MKVMQKRETAYVEIGSCSLMVGCWLDSHLAEVDNVASVVILIGPEQDPEEIPGWTPATWYALEREQLAYVRHQEHGAPSIPLPGSLPWDIAEMIDANNEKDAILALAVQRKITIPAAADIIDDWMEVYRTKLWQAKKASLKKDEAIVAQFEADPMPFMDWEKHTSFLGRLMGKPGSRPRRSSHYKVKVKVTPE